MHLLLPIILSILVWAAYSLLETAGVTENAVPIATETGFFATVAPVVAQIVPAGTLTVVDIPFSGCSSSLMNKDRVKELISLLPVEQQAPLHSLLDTSSGVWQAQFYAGELGMGICLPARAKLVLIPMAYVESVKAIGLKL